MSGDTHEIDLLIERCARALSEGAPQPGLGFKVRARVNARSAWWTGAPAWRAGIAGIAAAALLAVLSMPHTTPEPQVEPAVPRTADARMPPVMATGRPPDRSQTAQQSGVSPSAVERPRGVRVARPRYAPATRGVPETNLAPIAPTPLGFDPLDDRGLVVDAIADPMPLVVQRLTIQPLTLSEGDV